MSVIIPVLQKVGLEVNSEVRGFGLEFGEVREAYQR